VVGNGERARSWYWGETWEQATETCKRENERLGLTPNDVVAIIASSMRVSNLG
jgi:hypothetical protein